MNTPHSSQTSTGKGLTDSSDIQSRNESHQRDSKITLTHKGEPNAHVSDKQPPLTHQCATKRNAIHGEDEKALQNSHPITLNQDGEMFAQTGTLMVDAFYTDDRCDKKFVKHCLEHIPYVLRNRARQQYNHLRKVKRKGRFDANTYLRKLSEYCSGFHVVKSMNDEQIDTYATERANECHYVASNMLHEGESTPEVLAVLEGILRQNDINPRKGRDIRGDVARYVHCNYWFKKLKKVKARAVEQISRYMGIVNRQSQIYITDYNLRDRREAKRRTNCFLESMEMINECGDSINLKEASDRNVSNPVNRRNELMCRLDGMEAYANKHGYKATFLTVTAPSRMHAVIRTGFPNPKYDNTNATQTHQFMSNQWAKSRAALAREQIDYFGMRVVELHHDGTPHWHLLIFVNPQHMYKLEQIIQDYAMEVDGDEAGASKHRFTAKRIDKKKGTAIGYVAKYISKNIDGYGVDDDRYGKPANESAERICEWSGLHGIRQFQQFGGPSVTVWREARRIAIKQHYDDKFLSVLCAADSGNWCAFIEAMNGSNTKRNDRPVAIYREFIEEEGQFIEPIGYVIKGLCCNSEIYISREHEWTLRNKDRAQKQALSETAG